MVLLNELLAILPLFFQYRPVKIPSTRNTSSGPLLQIITDRGTIQTSDQSTSATDTEQHTDTERRTDTEEYMDTEQHILDTDIESSRSITPEPPRIRVMSAKLAKPSLFDGTNTSRSTILSWVFDIEQYLIISETPNELQTKYAASYLSGVAKTWYITTYGNRNTVTPLDEFIKAFKAFYLLATEIQDVYNSIENLKQGSRPAKDYVTDYKLLVAQLDNPGTDWIHYTFLKGLNRKLAEAVVNDLDPKDTLETICNKTLKKASITQLVEAIYANQASDKRNAYSSPKNTASPSTSTARSQASVNNRAGTRTVKLGKLTEEEKKLLVANKGCFLCRKINAGHIASNCPERKGSSTSNPTQTVKREEVSIIDGYVVRHPVSSEFESESDSYSSVPIITVPTKIQQSIVHAGVDPGASINVISPRVVKKHRLIELPAPLIRIHQALDSNGSSHDTKVVSTVTLPEESWTSTHKHEFTVAPLSNHDALLGMPFFTKESILIDPANRSLILPEPESKPITGHREPSASIIDTENPSTPFTQPSQTELGHSELIIVPEGYVKVGNAFMKLPSIELFELNKCIIDDYEDVLLDEGPGAEIFSIGVVGKHRWAVDKSGTARMDLSSIEQEIMMEYQDVFSDELPNRPPPADGPKHRIVLKDEKKVIKGRMMRVPNKYMKAFKQWIDEHVKAGRLILSKSHISSGTFLVPKKDPNAFPRVVHNY